jgi:glycosyltransferase involved in cell wall biosynthesis
MDDTIHILYLVDTLNDPRDDTVAHLRRLTRHLDAKQFHPCAITIGRAADGASSSSLLCSVEHVRLESTGPLAIAWARWQLWRRLRVTPCDLICAYGWAARSLGLPVAQSVHPAVRFSVVRDMGYGLNPQSLCSLQRSNQAAARFVASSGAAAARLVRQEMVRRDRIDIIPNGVDWQRIPERSPDSAAEAKHRFGLSIHQPVILMNAPFERPSDHTTFLKAAAFLSPLHKSARFVLLGHGSRQALERVRKVAGELNLLDQVVFVFDQTLDMQWIHAADVGVVASFVESYPDILLKFMAAGLPTVATEAGGTNEIIRHGKTGYIVEPREADGLAMRTHVLLLAQDLAAEFSAAARQRVHDEFSLEHEVQRYSDYYRTLALSAPSDGWLEVA